jgi:hypothetical protein
VKKSKRVTILLHSVFSKMDAWKNACLSNVVIKKVIYYQFLLEGIFLLEDGNELVQISMFSKWIMTV